MLGGLDSSGRAATARTSPIRAPLEGTVMACLPTGVTSVVEAERTASGRP